MMVGKNEPLPRIIRGMTVSHHLRPQCFRSIDSTLGLKMSTQKLSIDRQTSLPNRVRLLEREPEKTVDQMCTWTAQVRSAYQYCWELFH